MFAKAEVTGENVRLDCDMGKKGTLSEAEQICKRNSTIVRKLHQEEEQLEKNAYNDRESDEDEIMPTDFPDETLASDCVTKTGNFNVRKQTVSFRRGGVV